MQKLTFSLMLGVTIAACSPAPDTPPKTHHALDVIGNFQSKTYPINDVEHVTVFDVPNRILPDRCWVYVNERTRTSNMHCDTDGISSNNLPAQGPELDR